MNYSRFVREIFSSPLAIHPVELKALYPLYQQYLNGIPFQNEVAMPQFIKKDMNFFDWDDEEDTRQRMNEEDTVMVIPIEGAMMRTGCFSLGAEDIADMLYSAYQNESIKAVVLKNHSGGGSVNSIPPITNALKKKNKPVIAAIDTIGNSANYYVNTYTDQIFATHNIAEVGSIGIMAQVINDEKRDEERGIKVHLIVPPESNWKNKEYEEAKDGNYETIIKYSLSPLAQNFQNVVKTNRPNLNQDVEGILNGRTFYATDAMNYGLIDGIKPFDEIIEYAFNNAENKNLEQQLNYN